MEGGGDGDWEKGAEDKLGSQETMGDRALGRTVLGASGPEQWLVPASG